MEAVLSIISGVIMLALLYVRYMTAPDTKKAEEKRAFDEAIRKGDAVTLSALLSEQHDRLHSNNSDPKRPATENLSDA